MLIKCPECGGQVSDQANVCIHCGFPLDTLQKTEQEEEQFYDIAIENNPFLIDYKSELNYKNPSEQFKKAKEYLRIERWLLREVLGYTPEEAIKIASESYIKIVINVDSATVCKIIAPFISQNIKLYVYNHGTTGLTNLIKPDVVKGYNDISKEPKEHYYDTPIVTRDHLCDVLTPQPKPTPVYKPIVHQSQPTNIPKCPTCGSTNIKKISNLNRAASVSAFGLFSKKINKSFKCSSCGYTW